MEQLTYERLQENLQRLKLSRAAEVLDTTVAQAEKTEGSYLSFLDYLLEEEVADLARKENAIFLGLPGVGKTYLAIDLAIKACCHGFKVYFTTMNTLIGKLKETQSKGKAYLNSSLVIVDEVGYLPVNSQEAYLFFQFISYRYEKSSTIITSNKSFIDWQELFEDSIIASAILDRLLHHCKVINIKEHSYRLKEHAFKSNLFPKLGDDSMSSPSS